MKAVCTLLLFLAAQMLAFATMAASATDAAPGGCDVAMAEVADTCPEGPDAAGDCGMAAGCDQLRLSPGLLAEGPPSPGRAAMEWRFALADSAAKPAILTADPPPPRF